MIVKNKTIAAWLALLGGPFGMHRFYLYGSRDPAAWVLSFPSLLGLYGVWRARQWGLDDLWSWLLMPMLGFTFAGCALTAIVYGLMDAQRWNSRFNAATAQGDDDDDDGNGNGNGNGGTNWITIGAVVLALFFGTIALVATLAFSLQRLFEYQVLPVALGRP